MHAPAHAFLLTLVLIGVSCATTRVGTALLRFLLTPMSALWIASGAATIAWATYSGALSTVDWAGLGYFALVGTIAFVGLAILRQAYKMLKRWTG